MSDRRKNPFDTLAYPSLFFRRKEEASCFRSGRSGVRPTVSGLISCIDRTKTLGSISIALAVGVDVA